MTIDNENTELELEDVEIFEEDPTPYQRLLEGEWVKAIYLGFPVKIKVIEDADEDGGLEVKGFWSWVPLAFPTNHEIFVYEGFYLKGLFEWLFSSEEDLEGGPI